MALKLRLGKMSTKELAEWFGLAYSTFRKRKENLLKELNDYCLYDSIYGGVQIKYIYVEEYVNSKQNNNYKIVESHVDEEWDKSGLDTKINVAKKIYSKHQSELTIKQSTTYNYVRKAANVLYGPANNYNQSGLIGNCWYKICIVNENGIRRQLTEEEQKRRREIRQKYCSDEEKEKREDIEDTIELQYKAGKITKEAKNEIREQLNAWRWNYLQEFEQTLAPGEKISYGTFKYTFDKKEENQSAF